MTKEREDGGPAYPSREARVLYPKNMDKELYNQLEKIEYTTSGMSLRDWLAGKALQGMLSRDTVKERTNNPLFKWAHISQLEDNPSGAVNRSYAMADAMLAARGK